MSKRSVRALSVATWTCMALACTVERLQAETVLRVDAASTNPAPDGSSWTSAFKTLDAALSAAIAGQPTQIWVAASTVPYRPDPSGLSDPRDASFTLTIHVSVYGGFLGLAPGGGETRLDQRDPAAHVTVLSGDLNGDDVGSLDDPSRNENCYHVVTGSPSILDGFTISGGNANGTGSDRSLGGGIHLLYAMGQIVGCRIASNRAAGGASNGGAGAYSGGGNVSFDNCEFADNEADLGGGLYLFLGEATITHCSFIGNTSRYITDTYNYGGGGLYCSNSNAMVSNCEFTENVASNCGAGINARGSPAPSIRGCTFTGNTAKYGGGVFNDSAASEITECQFVANSGLYGGGMMNSACGATTSKCIFRGNSATTYYGGAVSTYWSADTWSDCTFVGNSAKRGGAVEGYYPSSTFQNCTFGGNDATEYGGALYSRYVNTSSMTVLRCVFGENAAAHGGAIYSSSTPTRLIDCIFAGNVAANWGGACDYIGSSGLMAGCAFIGNSGAYGGAVLNQSCQPQIINCSFSRNSVTATGSAVYNTQSNSTIANCAFWANQVKTVVGPGSIYDASSTPSVTYSCIQDSVADDGIIPYGGAANGNTDLSPQWVDGPSGSWTAAPSFDPVTGTTTFTDAAGQFQPDGLVGMFLRPNTTQPRSGYITANTPTTVTVVGDFSSLAGPGSAYAVLGFNLAAGSPCVDSGDTATVPADLTIDLLGHPRILNLHVDMGAYEFVPPLPGDYDHDGDADNDDLPLFEDCGTGPGIETVAPACQMMDFDQDNDVDQSDFSVLQRCLSGPQLPVDPNCDD